MEAIFLFIILTLVGGLFVLLLRKKDTDAVGNQQAKDLRQAINLMQLQFMEHLEKRLDAVRQTVGDTTRVMNTEAKAFAQRTTEIDERLKQMHESVRDLKKFEEFFKSPKARGTWGEASLAHLLSQHYAQDLYELQYGFLSGERADAVFKLPDGKLVSIDAKFPADNFTKMAEAQNEIEREAAEKSFINDVKARIDEIAAKYILPSESTVDYAIMYVPAEAIYYEIINPGTKSTKEDLSSYALRKKVILTSPNLFYLTMNVIEHWFKDVQFSKQTKEVIKRFEQVRKDAEKLADDFGRLGKHLSNAQSSYDDTTKRLDLMTDRVDRLIEGSSPEKELE
jgi:DNA recombination protein RmuC